MRIAFYCNDGSPTTIIPPDLYKRGLGGAENALVSLTEELARRGHEVTVYNDPREGGVYDGVQYAPKSHYLDDVDVLIFFRSPNELVRRTRVPLKIFWSCDPYTVGNYRTDILPHVDATVCISPHHREFFLHAYQANPDKTTYIDLGVRLQDYDCLSAEIERTPRRLIFCSMPERGLDRLRAMWGRIRERVPDVSLVITADHRMWSGGDQTSKYRRDWDGVPNVHYFGALPRMELVKYQLQADIHAYPCIYEEMFCISAAECQVAGAVPLTSTRAALRTTNSFGFPLEGNPDDGGWLLEWADRLCDLLTTDYHILDPWRKEMQKAARERFGWSTIADQWEKLLETGLQGT